MKDVLQMDCWLEGGIHNGRIKKGQRLISNKGRIIAVFNRDLTEEETQAGVIGKGASDPDYVTFLRP